MSRLNSAGSSVTDLVGVIPIMNMDGGQPPVYFFPELSGTQAFKAGEMVCLSGTAARGTAGAIGLTRAGTDASGFGIIGFAADKASGTTAAAKGVFVALPGIVFIANVGHSTTSANAQTAATDLGQLYGLTSLSGRTYVDKLKTSISTVMCRILKLCDEDATPSFYGKVQFQVLSPKCQLVNHIAVDTSSPLANSV